MAKRRQEHPQKGANKPARPTEPDAPVEQQAKRQAKPKAKPKPRDPAMPWHPFWRFLVSVLVLFHLVAVFSAPWDLDTFPAMPPRPVVDSQGRLADPPAEELQQPVLTRSVHLWPIIRHYLNALYLNHGYQFFAPDPPVNKVSDYSIIKSDGSKIEGRFPDRGQQWPRLLYHRHMMLVDQSGLIDELMEEKFRRTGQRYPFAGKMYAEYLATLHDAPARLDLKLHLLLSPAEILAGKQPTDETTYYVLGTETGNPRVELNKEAVGNQSQEPPVAIPGANQ